MAMIALQSSDKRSRLEARTDDKLAIIQLEAGHAVVSPLSCAASPIPGRDNAVGLETTKLFSSLFSLI